MRREDIEADPCDCPECTQAGVAGQSPRRDPHSGMWLHGYNLKRWLDAKAKFEKAFEQLKSGR